MLNKNTFQGKNEADVLYLACSKQANKFQYALQESLAQYLETEEQKVKWHLNKLCEH